LSTQPKITLAVPVFNSSKTLPRVLQAVTGLQYPKHLIKLVFPYTQSEDDTIRIVRNFINEHGNEYLSAEVAECGTGISVARNVALKLAGDTEYVFLDSDIIPPSPTPPQVLPKHWRGMKRPVAAHY